MWKGWSPICWPNRDTRIVCNFRDVTERVMAEVAQKQVDLRFRALIENSADLIMMANAMGQSSLMVHLL